MQLNIPSGEKITKEFEVAPGHAAVIIKEVGVLSTPSMISFIELASWELAQRYLPEGYTSVGTKVCVSHVSPAPVGSKVTVESRLVKVDGRKLVFEARVTLGGRLIGEGTHERFVVSTSKFIEKVRKLATT